MVYKLGLDIGNSGIKMAGKLSDGTYMLNNIKALVTYDPSDISHTVQLEEDEKPLYFSVGDPLTAQDKTKRPHLNQILLLGLATTFKGVTDCDKVKIGIGLPLNDYKNTHKLKEYQEELKKITQISGHVNGEYYLFNTDIQVFAEGFSAFYYLSNELDKSYRWLIPDHGYRSTDVVSVSWNPTIGRWKIDHSVSIGRGLLEMYGSISSKFSLITREDPHSAQDVEYHMRENIKVMTANEEYPEVNMNDFSDGAIEDINRIYNDIELKFGNINGHKILLMGGGANLVYKHLNRPHKVLKDDNEGLTTRIYANAMGFYLQLK